jgi:hypothetical protein
MKRAFILISTIACMLLGAALPVQAQTNSKQASEAASKHRAEKAAGQTTSTATTNTSKSSTTKSSPPAASTASLDARLDACEKDAGINPVAKQKCYWSICRTQWHTDRCSRYKNANRDTSDR